MKDYVTVIGGGLAGSEAAYQIAKRGVKVKLYEMRPVKMTPAHTTGDLAEIVCSNSMGSIEETTASGLLKKELLLLDSIIIRTAFETRVPAGHALAVDRKLFSAKVTEKLEQMENIEIIREEVKSIPEEGPVIIATGPLTSDEFSKSIMKFTERKNLFFYDATTPIVTAESINMEKAFKGARYGKGGDDYINCPMTEEEYRRFYYELINAETVEPHEFEKDKFFENCLPIEELAKRGFKTLLFGPLKPVGLIDPRTGRQPFAVVQLRQDDIAAQLYSMVGFQTRLKWGEQKRVFRLIPGLENAVFVRYGTVHRNTYINSPVILRETYQSRKREDLFFAGQLTGVEGYVESTASGLLAGIFAVKLLRGEKLEPPPRTTAVGALAFYVTHANWRNFQPMNFVFGILEPLPRRIRDAKRRRLAYTERALAHLREWMKRNGIAEE